MKLPGGPADPSDGDMTVHAPFLDDLLNGLLNK